jgi:mannosyltransferase OCH1-like enzyme
MICSYSTKKAMQIRKQLIQKTKKKRYYVTSLPFHKPKPTIPLHIYQIWHDLKEMPSSVKESIQHIKEQNPEFQHHLYDEPMCRTFIKDNFPKKVLHAYDSIVPHAYKADLWRYCILYKKGGIYLDSKYYGVEGFKLIQLTGKEYFCKGVSNTFFSVYNAILICKPRNPILAKAIQKVVEQVETRYYGSVPWCIGPLMMRSFLTDRSFDTLELSLDYVNKVKRYIRYQGHRILKYNEAYQKEKAQRSEHWTKYWEKRQLYERSIPSILLQTSKDPPPAYVVKQLKEHSIGWEYMHFTDKDILQFFKDYPLKEFPKIAEVFHSFEKGEHKADLFRYYFLYIKGGVFIDLDAMLQVDLDQIACNHEFFSVESKYIRPKSIYQGLIGSTPNNKIIYESLKDIYTISTEELKDYFIIVKRLYRIVQQYKHLYNTKLYVEKWTIKPHETKNGKYCESITFDEDTKIKLLIHYPCNGKIPHNKL